MTELKLKNVNFKFSNKGITDCMIVPFQTMIEDAKYQCRCFGEWKLHMSKDGQQINLDKHKVIVF